MTTEPTNAAAKLFAGQPLTPDELDAATHELTSRPSVCRCPMAAGTINTATYIVRCDECALVMLAGSLTELLHRHQANFAAEFDRRMEKELEGYPGRIVRRFLDDYGADRLGQVVEIEGDDDGPHPCPECGTRSGHHHLECPNDAELAGGDK